MISHECKSAGVLNAQGKYDEAELEHKECPGSTWCDCACVVGPGATTTPARAARPAETIVELPAPPAEPAHHYPSLQRAYNLGRDDALRSVEHMTGYNIVAVGL